MNHKKYMPIVTPILLGLNLFFTPNMLFAQENANSLNLETAMNLAENYSFSAKLATSNENIANSQKNSLLLSMFPNLSASGTYYKYSDSVNKAVGTPAGAMLGIPGKTVSSAGLTISQPLVGLIPMFLNLKAAAIQTEIALQNKEKSKADARFLGASSFINAVEARQLLTVANSSTQVAQTQLQDGTAQFNAGKLTNADVLKFKLNLENAKTSAFQADTMAKITLTSLSETTGLKDVSQITLPQNYTSIWETKKSNLKNLDEYISMALNSRNELQAARLGLNGAQAKAKASMSSYLPSVNLIANYSRNFEAQDTTQGSAAFKKSDIQNMFFYGIQLNWNIVDWGSRQAQINASIEGETSAQTQIDEAESQIKIEVTNNYLKLLDAYQTLSSAKVSVEYAKDVFLQMEAQFNNGQATTTDVLAASNDQTSALARLANATGDLDLAWLNLQKSVGQQLTTLTN